MAADRSFAPRSVRLVVVGGPVLLGVVLALLAVTVLGSPLGVVLAAVLLVAAAGLAARAWPVAVVVEDDRIRVRNLIRRCEVAAPEIERVQADRVGGRIGRTGVVVGLVRPGGTVVRPLATLAVPGSAHQRAELSLVLRRWCDRNGVEDDLPHREYGDHSTRRDLLEAGEEVEVRAWVRRTDSRGWGGWEIGTLHLPAPRPATGDRPAPEARWTRDKRGDPLEILATPVTRPLQVRGAEKVVTRAARFPEEEYFGPDTTFLVVTTMRRTLEVGLQGDEADLVHTRIRQLDGEEPVPPEILARLERPAPEPATAAEAAGTPADEDEATPVEKAEEPTAETEAEEPTAETEAEEPTAETEADAAGEPTPTDGVDEPADGDDGSGGEAVDPPADADADVPAGAGAAELSPPAVPPMPAIEEAG